MQSGAPQKHANAKRTPAGQCEHRRYCSCVWKRPGGHGKHDAPAPYAPGRQLYTQLSPVAMLFLPPGQNVHASAPGSATNFPVGHRMQRICGDHAPPAAPSAPSPSANVPTGHSSHATAAPLAPRASWLPFAQAETQASRRSELKVSTGHQPHENSAAARRSPGMQNSHWRLTPARRESCAWPTAVPVSLWSCPGGQWNEQAALSATAS